MAYPISGHPSAASRAQDSERTPAKDRCSTAGLRNQRRADYIAECSASHGEDWPRSLGRLELRTVSTLKARNDRLHHAVQIACDGLLLRQREDDPNGEEAKWLHLADGRLITPPRRRDSGCLSVRSREMAPPMSALSAECLCDRKPCVYELVIAPRKLLAKSGLQPVKTRREVVH